MLIALFIAVLLHDDLMSREEYVVGGQTTVYRCDIIIISCLLTLLMRKLHFVYGCSVMFTSKKFFVYRYTCNDTECDPVGS